MREAEIFVDKAEQDKLDKICFAASAAIEENGSSFQAFALKLQSLTEIKKGICPDRSVVTQRHTYCGKLLYKKMALVTRTIVNSALGIAYWKQCYRTNTTT